MKKLLLVTLAFMAIPLFAGTSKHDPTMPKQKAPVTGPKEPKISGMPAHHAAVNVPAAHAAKSGSVDAQLNDLEKKNSKIGGDSATQKKQTPARKSAALTPAKTEAGNKPIDFKHQPLKNNTSRNTSGKASSKKGSSGYRVGH